MQNHFFFWNIARTSFVFAEHLEWCADGHNKDSSFLAHDKQLSNKSRVLVRKEKKGLDAFDKQQRDRMALN